MIRRKIIIYTFAIFMMSPLALVFASSVNLPRTGKTTCYDSSGETIDNTNQARMAADGDSAF